MEVNRKKVLSLQTAYVKAIRQRRHAYTVVHAGREFVVLPGVFPPYLDSALVTRAMRISPDDAVLEVGAGTGAIAVLAAQHAKLVVATDINPAAVENVRSNASRHSLDGNLIAIEADLFPPRHYRFDVVIFNPPYTDHPATDVAEQSVWDPGHATIRRFFSGLRDVLRPGGRVYLGWADFADLDFIEALIAEHGASFQCVAADRDEVSRFVVYEVTFKAAFRRRRSSRI